MQVGASRPTGQSMDRKPHPVMQSQLPLPVTPLLALLLLRPHKA